MPIETVSGKHPTTILRLLHDGYTMTTTVVEAVAQYKYSNRGFFPKYFKVLRDHHRHPTWYHPYDDMSIEIIELFIFIAKEIYQKKLSLFTLYSLAGVTNEITQQLLVDELCLLSIPHIFFYKPMGIDRWLTRDICPHMIWPYNERHSNFMTPPDDLRILVPDTYPSVSQPGFGTELDITSIEFDTLTWSKHCLTDDLVNVGSIVDEMRYTVTRNFAVDVAINHHQLLLLFDLQKHHIEIVDPYGRSGCDMSMNMLTHIVKEVAPNFKIASTKLNIQDNSSSMVPGHANCVSLSICYLYLRVHYPEVDSIMLQVYMCYIFSDPIVAWLYHHSWRSHWNSYRSIPYKNVIDTRVLDFIKNES